MIAITLTIIIIWLVAFGLGWHFGNRTKVSIILGIILSSLFSLFVFIYPEEISHHTFDFTRFYYFDNAPPTVIGIFVSFYVFGILLKRHLFRYSLIPVFVSCILIFIMLEIDIITPVKSFIYQPTEIIETDTSTIYKYRFGKVEKIDKPISLEQSHIFLDSLIGCDEIIKMEANNLHFSLGLYIRNNWGFWSGKSFLAKDLRSLDITHPDNMSTFVIESYLARCKKKNNDDFDSTTFYKGIQDCKCPNP